VSQPPHEARHFTQEHGVTEAEYHSLIAVITEGTQAKAAAHLGLNVQTLKNHLQTARKRVGAKNLMDVYVKLGWLHLPTGSHPAGEDHHFGLKCVVCGQRVLVTLTDE
jgi:DNA-binding CsgD family transcriptional regulator